MSRHNMIRGRRGFSLIEVMVAVAVLSFGLVALVALQGGLFRANAEAKARANALTLAQNALENARSYVFTKADSAPDGYKGGTYFGLATQAGSKTSMGGVEYTVTQTVTTQNAGAIEEYKDIRITVSWQGPDETKQIELVDSVPNISPRDAIQVMKKSSDAESGPQVWIVPPNKNNPTVVPIAIGDDKSAASSNPKPEQFVDDLSAVTTFTVMSFTGSPSGSEVRLGRRLDVAGVSCLCQRSGAEVSTKDAPAYLPTIWNGKQQAYMEPKVAPAGTKIGTPVTTNSDITPLCTACCRDHHEASGRSSPRVDPWRQLASGESPEEHWGYKKKGGNYVVGEPLVQWGTGTSATSGEYLEACQLIRVNGRMRVAVDAQQTDLVVSPLNDAATTYRDSNFISRYSSYVKDLVKSGVANLPAGYAAPTARFPGASSALKTTYSDVTSPATIDVTTAAVGAKRQMLGFGLYMDYLSKDTLDAYNCALTKNNTGACAGLGKLDPLETLPFYALNVANLGTWTSSRTGVISVADAQYKNGLLESDGGIATVQSGSLGTSAAPQNIVMTLQTSNSNSGLAGTRPVDPDDAAESNVLASIQNFTRFGTANTTPSRNSLFVKLSSSSTLSLSAISVSIGNVVCSAVSKNDATKNCRFDSPASSVQISVTGYTTSKKVSGKTVIEDRKVCVPSGVSATVTGNSTTGDTTVMTFTNLAAKDYTLTIDVIGETGTCPSGTATFI